MKHPFELLNQMRFGKYLLAQNLSQPKTFSMQAMGVKRAVDLTTKRIYTHFPVLVRPRTTLGLEILSDTEPKEKK